VDEKGIVKGIGATIRRVVVREVKIAMKIKDVNIQIARKKSLVDPIDDKKACIHYGVM